MFLFFSDCFPFNFNFYYNFSLLDLSFVRSSIPSVDCCAFKVINAAKKFEISEVDGGEKLPNLKIFVSVFNDRLGDSSESGIRILMRIGHQMLLRVFHEIIKEVFNELINFALLIHSGSLSGHSTNLSFEYS